MRTDASRLNSQRKKTTTMTIDNFGRIALILLLALQAGACGLKGDLYIPEEQTAAETPPAAEQPVPPEATVDDESGAKTDDERRDD